MAEVWVVNASPIISLGRIGALHLLGHLGREIVVPAAVLVEVGRGAKPLTAADIGAHRPVVVAETHPIVAAWDLGLGESEVISWAAAQPAAIAVIDDRAARRCAEALSVPTRGTVSVILEAKKAGLIPAVATLLRALQANGFFLSEALVENALRLAGESR